MSHERKTFNAYYIENEFDLEDFHEVFVMKEIDPTYLVMINGEFREDIYFDADRYFDWNYYEVGIHTDDDERTYYHVFAKKHIKPSDLFYSEKINYIAY